MLRLGVSGFGVSIGLGLRLWVSIVLGLRFPLFRGIRAQSSGAGNVDFRWASFFSVL